MTTGTCPHCQREIDVARLRDDDAWRELTRLVSSLPAVVQLPLWNYLDLFVPLKQQRIRSTRMLNIISELAPMIKAGQLNYKNTTYAITTAKWASALMYLIETPPQTMPQPLKGNGYLLGMMVNRAEALLAKGELDKDTRLRAVTTEQPRAGTFDVEAWKESFPTEAKS